MAVMNKMKTHNVRVEPEGKTYIAEHGSSLYDLLKGDNVEFTCGGKGLCGKCAVRLVSGKVKIDSVHAALLKKKKISENMIIACLSKVEDDLVIAVPDSLMEIQTDDSSYGFVPEEGMGIAVDLGSTTIVLQLVDLHSGKVTATRYGVNPQVKYGADIISRIQYAVKSEEGRKLLGQCVRDYVKQQIISIQSEHKELDIRKTVLVGNTVMHHLFLGYDVTPLAFLPFDSPMKAGVSLKAEDMGWTFLPECRVDFLPNLSHFVGSDIIGGIHASGMLCDDAYSMLVDLGTNGEIVLGNKHELLYTSTAAGPAFEGLNISCGMKAATGAVSAVELVDNKLRLDVIGGVEARGICGSGLIDSIYCLLQQGTIDFTGAFTDTERKYAVLSEHVSLTIEDIRNFQLAKAALSAGMVLLMKEKALSPGDLAHVYLTGGLGNHLNLKKAQQLGLFSGFDEAQMRFLDNAALSGCKQFLFESNRAIIGNIVARGHFCPLENTKNFSDVFCDNMFFCAL